MVQDRNLKYEKNKLWITGDECEKIQIIYAQIRRKQIARKSNIRYIFQTVTLRRLFSLVTSDCSCRISCKF